ncbi:MAG TPA: PEP-CTERM sorting domain-containing protein [Candidatus Eisenbacteria bacterium]|nr:PEP-CTERM sorting domain-containing protein [Candidatus Eisenbacteria bacterium]
MARCLKIRRALIVWSAVIMLLTVPGWAAQVLVYSQPTDLNGGYASQNDPSLGGFATAFDNFTLGSSANINQVTWVGSYITGVGGITGYTLGFWSNSGNAPGSLLMSYSVGGNAGEASMGTDNLGNPVFGYSLMLGSSFAAAAGTEYWLSIVPDLAFPPQWLWETGTGGDSNNYQCFFGTCGNNPYDQAFALYAQQQTTIPEPSSLMLLGSGILGAAGLLRRKLKG